jgi:ketosteroid isomerase-like protein|tara:strand:- start:159 stop:503 length:345 start_codon:yes stop_codon:yes gene_type:complete
MPGQAEDLIRDYWKSCEPGDFNKLTPYYAEDAILIDPIYGTFTGRDKISGFMEQMTGVMKEANSQFSVEEVAGDETCAWSRWKATTADGVATGSSIYRIQDGLITFEQDYTNPP